VAASFTDCEIDAKTLTCIHCQEPIKRATIRRVCSALGVAKVLAEKELSWASKASNYAAAITKWLKAGRLTRTQAEIDQLLTEHCTPCERYRDGNCSACGCRVNRGTLPFLNKLAMATESCPLGKFHGSDYVAPARPGLRVAFVIPCLMTGGVESWLWSLVSQWHRGDKIRCTGVALSSGSYSPAMLRQLSSLVPIVGPVEADGVAYSSNPIDSAKAIGADADVVIVWAQMPTVIAAAKSSGAMTVGVSHACEEWWARGARHVDRWVAVHQVAVGTLPDGQADAIIGNGVDVERCVSGLSKAEARERLGIPPEAKVYGYIGRFAHEKRVPEIAGALDHLGPEWHCLLVGSGREQPATRERLHIMAPSRDIGDLWRACDVGVIASKYESWCLAADEIHAAEIPLVSTRVGAIIDAAEWLSDEPTPQEIAAAIEASHGRQSPGLPPERTAKAMADAWAQWLVNCRKT
jgi:hypothetical protein